jgi:CrcB protein
MNALTYLLVALGGAIGSVARAWVGVTAVRLVGASFPWGTMVINVVGSLVIGMVAATALSPTRTLFTQEVRIFLMVGFCGGFTTFSSFSLQTFELLREGRPAAALANVALSVVLCIVATAAGYAGGSAFAGR